MTKFHEPNLCDGCGNHCVIHRCLRYGLMSKPRTKRCKYRQLPKDHKTEVSVESQLPLDELLGET